MDDEDRVLSTLLACQTTDASHSPSCFAQRLLEHGHVLLRAAVTGLQLHPNRRSVVIYNLTEQHPDAKKYLLPEGTKILAEFDPGMNPLGNNTCSNES